MRTELDQYLLWLQATGKRENTIRNYNSDLLKFINWGEEQGITDVTEVNRALLRRYLFHIGGQYASTSVARMVATLRAWGDFLVRDRALEQNIFRLITALPEATYIGEPTTRLLGLPTKIVSPL